MAQASLPRSVLQETMDRLAEHGGNRSQAAASLGIPQPTFHNRIMRAREAGIVASVPAKDEAAALRERVAVLEARLASVDRDTLDTRYVKEKIIGLRDAERYVPEWTSKPRKVKSDTGIPTLMLSDFHWSEIVDPRQLNGKNEFNIEIARRRLWNTVEHAVDLCKQHITNKGYPAICVILGGDMITGDIHEELTATNEMEVMPSVLDLWSALQAALAYLADEFGHVDAHCVTGNHGRNTHKIRAKGRAFTSFDWLVYQFLAKAFERDKRFTWHIPDGPDALYSVYSHRYLLTHGDQFRGGDGMIGALGPIIRGDHRKRSRNAQIDMSYDTMLLGHWHQYIHLTRLIVNGSLKGYDEYAYSNNFGFEPAQQALWITHPVNGITFRMPVFCDRAEHDSSLRKSAK